jgi:hypothetical protein
MKRILLFFAVICCVTGSYAQYRSSFKPNYTFAFGARAGATGATSGLALKGFFGESFAIEGIVGYWHGGPTATVLFEKHIPAFGVRGLNWFVGGGAHYIGKTGYSKWYIIDQRGYDYENGGAGYGIDAITGLEYKVPAAPVAFGIDIKPAMEFSSNKGFAVAIDPGISVKIAF